MNSKTSGHLEVLLAVMVMVLSVLSTACNTSQGRVNSIVGCYEPLISPIPADEPNPRWVMLDSAQTRDLPQPRPEGRYVARFPGGYESDFTWYGGWEPIGADSIKVDWNRTGEWIEMRLVFRDTLLAGTAVVNTDIRDSVRTYSVHAQSVPCD